MLLLLASIALADNVVPTFVVDPAYTDAPFAGMEQLFVDPAVVSPQLKPAAAAPAGEKLITPAGKGSLDFTNPMSQWAELSVNGLKIGIIGPYASCRLQGLGAGWYSVDATVSTGFTRHFAVEVK